MGILKTVARDDLGLFRIPGLKNDHSAHSRAKNHKKAVGISLALTRLKEKRLKPVYCNVLTCLFMAKALSEVFKNKWRKQCLLKI